MTNKFYRKDAILSVYVVNLAEYVKYNLVEDYTNPNPTEDWVSLPISKEDWEEFLATIGNPEEYAIHYYENNSGLDGLKIGEYMSLKELNELCERIERIDLYLRGVDTFNALYEVLGDFGKALECFEVENYVFYGKMTMEEVAREHIGKCYYVPAGLENYIDYKAFARDMLSGSYYKTVYGVIEIL